MKKIVLLLFVAVIAMAGCQSLTGQQQQPVQTQAPMPQLNQAFYSFADVPVPRELEYVRDRSFVFEMPGFKAGVMVFSGNVDLVSLENYFKMNMAKNGWKNINIFRYKDIVMNYVKDERTCNIKMSRGSFATDVEIWVGPANKETPPREMMGPRLNGPK